jgi:hypothetical protein
MASLTGGGIAHYKIGDTRVMQRNAMHSNPLQIVRVEEDELYIAPDPVRVYVHAIF